MLEATILYPIAVFVAVAVAWWSVARRLSWWQVAARVLLVVYLAWLFGATFFPVSLEGESVYEALLSRLNQPNIIPFHTIIETLTLPSTWIKVRLLLGNVLVFVPFGVLAPVIWPRLGRAWRMLLAGLVLSVGIELGQLAVSLLLGYWYRMTDIDDVLLNVAGVMLGFAVYWAAGRGASGRSASEHAGGDGDDSAGG